MVKTETIVRRGLRVTFAVVLALSTSACTGTIFKVRSLSAGQVLSIDARQRLVLVGTRADGQTVYCAEPSPDAIVARASYAAVQGNATSATGGSAGGQGAFGNSESVGSLALRTQTIQLLRDGYYRICEAYLNGAIDPKQYRDVLYVIDLFMIALVAMEGVGGVVAAPAIAIGANGRLTLAPDGQIDGDTTSEPAVISSVTSQTATLEPHQSAAITNIVQQYFALRLKIAQVQAGPG